MAWIKPGPGRPKGSKTKQQLGIEEMLASVGCDPILGMAKIALGEVPCLNPKCSAECETCEGSGLQPVPLDLRAKMFSELAQYVAPKRKAVEHTGDITTHAFVIMGALPDATAADWERRNQEMLQ